MTEYRRDLNREKREKTAHSSVSHGEKSGLKADSNTLHMSKVSGEKKSTAIKKNARKTENVKKVSSGNKSYASDVRSGNKAKVSQTGRKRKRPSRKKIRFMKRLPIILGIILAILLLILGIGYYQYQKALHSTEKLPLSDSVLAYRETVDQYAAEYDLQDYTDYIMAIIQVESGGNGSDIMQSSESAGLEVNTYSPEESIEQGCAYFRELLNALNYFDGDMDTLLQAYNYGNNFIVYVSENGGKYTFDLSTEYAKEKSGGEKVSYWNIVALRHNMNWRYAYGNMFYVDLIHQYL